MSKFAIASFLAAVAAISGGSGSAFAQTVATQPVATQPASPGSAGAPLGTGASLGSTLPGGSSAASGGGSTKGTDAAPISRLASTTTTAAAASVASDYRIEPDDTIMIGVARHGDVTGTFRIAPDGLIRLPRLITAIDVRNKTADDLVGEISKRLVTEGKLVIRPGQVTVVVVGTRIRRIFVRGNAVHGSDFDLKNGWRIDDLVALMGSLPQPDRLTANVTNPERPNAIPINLDAALKNPVSPDNLALVEGDTLTIDQPGVKRLMIKGEGPRGLHEVDERFGLRQALISLGFSTSGATGDLRNARLIRNAKAGDASTPATFIPVDLYTLLAHDSAPDLQYHDLDTLEIPVSDQYVYVLGEIGGPRKWYLPQDRKTYLIDVYSNAGDVTGNAKLGSIQITRQMADGKWMHDSYDLGQFFKNANAKNNPEIYPHDMIYVPSNNRVDPISSIWTGWGIYSILKAISPTL